MQAIVMADSSSFAVLLFNMPSHTGKTSATQGPAAEIGWVQHQDFARISRRHHLLLPPKLHSVIIKSKKQTKYHKWSQVAGRGCKGISHLFEIYLPLLSFFYIVTVPLCSGSECRRGKEGGQHFTLPISVCYSISCYIIWAAATYQVGFMFCVQGVIGRRL